MKNLAIQLLLLIFCGMVHAQQAVVNNGNMRIHTGASITGFGNFTNASTAALVNNGNLYVKGTLTNNQSAMAAGTGTLYLNGSSSQSLAGTQPFQTWNFVSNNGSGISLNNNLGVSGTHTFTAGIITTSATPNYLMYQAGSSYSGDGDSRHVNGWVKKTGTTNFIFPVGNGTFERTAALNSLSVSSEFNVRYLSTTPNSYSLQSPVWDVNESEYWSISKISGGSASVRLNWDNSKVFFPNWIVPDILVAGYNGSVWTDNGGGGTATGTAATSGAVSSNSVSAFNLFVLGSRTYILPLTLVNFTAYRQGNYTAIDWTTEREYNMHHFVVERSEDGLSFYPISQSLARNSGSTEQYSNRDYAPIRHIAYYRLRSVDINNQETLSRTVAVTVAGNNLFTLLTNPVHDKITLLASGLLNGAFNYTITAMNGQLTQQGKLMVQTSGSSQIELKATTKPGIYTLEVSQGMENFRFKVIVQ